jgi:sulfatase modifying factor 1
MRYAQAVSRALIFALATVLPAAGLAQALSHKVPEEIVGRDGTRMALVPAGDFIMGENQPSGIASILQGLSPHDANQDQGPQRNIYLDGFYVDIYEVTTSRYAKFLHATKRKSPALWSDVRLAEQGDRPVIGVSWHDADAYCRWIGKRLPSEAEWEKAARGVDGRKYPWGNRTPSRVFARYDWGAEDEDWKGYEMLSPAGNYAFGRSPYGLYDMAGNAWEWVADYYDKDYYKTGPVKNPKGPKTGAERVVRGGSWSGPAYPVYVRAHEMPEKKRSNLGFRCARTGPK